MVAPLYYCAGCNETYATDAADPVCDHCGSPMVRDSGAVTQPWLERTQLTDTQVRLVTGYDDDLLGTEFGDYRLDELIGHGGTARVYRGTHLLLDRPCAVKVLHAELVARHPEFVGMFFHEARSAASLVHPHVVTIHSIGEMSGRHYIEMEYVLGNSLWNLRFSPRPPDSEDATRLMMETCTGLAEAHQREIIHRDLKPANILVTVHRRAKLADFGLAKQINPTGKRLGKLMGTPHFMAPELFSDAAANQQSDIYALGATFYFLLTGRMPFIASELEEIARLHAQEAYRDPREYDDTIPEGVVDFIHSCLAKRPGDRFRDACEALADLRVAYGRQRNLRRLVGEALDGQEFQLREDGDRIHVTVNVSDHRRQKIVIEPTRGAETQESLVRIYSLCGPYRHEYTERALRLNARLEHGSIAVEEIDDAPYFIMVNNYPRATCDPEEIRHSVIEMAQFADEVEADLTDDDKH